MKYIAIFLCLALSGCVVVTTKGRYQNNLNTTYEKGLDEGAKQHIENYVEAMHTKNIIFMGMHSLTKYYQSIEDLILIKNTQIEVTNATGLFKEEVEADIAKLRKKQEEIMDEVFKRKQQSIKGTR